jgi:RNA polymerase sigma-70 factor (ECF subfamily)
MPSSARGHPLHDEHIGYLVRQARSMGVPSHEIDDLVQDTLVKAVELLPTFRGDAKTTTWLYKILLNVWRNGHRRIVRRDRKHHDLEMRYLAIERSQFESSAFEAERGLALRELRAFVDTLTPEAREAFVARALRGLDRREAAMLLGVEPAVLDRRLGSATSRFDEQFEHRKRKTRGQQSSTGRLGIAVPIWMPIARWSIQSTIGGLLSVFSCVAIGLWLIAATTPKTEARVGERGTAVDRRDAAPCPVGQATPAMLAEPQSPASPIVVELPNIRTSTREHPRARQIERAAVALDDPQQLALSRQLRFAGQWTAALEHIRKIDPSGPLARERWGNEVGILCALGRVSEAVAVVEQWLTQYPQDRTALRRSCVQNELP